MLRRLWGPGITPHKASSCGQLVGQPGGLYRIGEHAALCDEDTGGGGWTLVASSRVPPSDLGGAWYPDLATLQPQNANPHLWYPDELSAPLSDFRFSCATEACESATNCTFAVDIAFYKNAWYEWIAAEQYRIRSYRDEQRCFDTRRRHPKGCNLLTGQCRDVWYGIAAEADSIETQCSRWSRGDFAITFERDFELSAFTNSTTAWGRSRGDWRCGNVTCNLHNRSDGGACAWFSWVRGPPTQLMPADESVFGSAWNDVERSFFSDLFFYSMGAIVSITLPLMAYMFATVLFFIANKATGEGGSAHVRPTLSYRRVPRGCKSVDADASASGTLGSGDHASASGRVGCGSERQRIASPVAVAPGKDAVADPKVLTPLASCDTSSSSGMERVSPIATPTGSAGSGSAHGLAASSRRPSGGAPQSGVLELT